MSRQLLNFRSFLLVASLCVATVSLHAASADKEFKGQGGGNGNASNPTNYLNTNNGNTSQTPPGQNDRVKVDKTLDTTGAEIPLTLVENLTWGSLEFLGGKITGAHLLTLRDATSTWTGGEFTSGTFHLPGLTIGTGANAKKVSMGAKLNLSGTTNWNADKITTGGASELNNSGTFTTSFDGKIEHDNASSRATFKNDGTFTKSNASSGTTEVEAIFNNNGTVNVTAGTLKLSGGGAGTSGSTVSVSSGATLQLAGNNYAFTGSTLSGAGTIDVAGATTTFNGNSGAANLKVSGGTAKFESNHSTSGSLTVTSGVVDGGSGATTSVDGGFAWNGGDIKTTKVSSGGNATISAGSAKRLIDGAQLTLNGTTTWDGSTISTGGSSFLTNQAAGQFTVTADGTIAHDIDGNRATFTNAGTFTKSAGAPGGATEIQSKFDNTGTVSVGAGKLKLSGGGTSTGNVSLTGTLEVSGTDYTFTGGTLSGAGTIDLGGGVTTFSNTSGSANLKVSMGGNARFSGNHTTSGALTLSAGVVDGTGTASVGSLAWTGGDISAATVNTSGATIGTGGTKKITSGAQLNLSGTTTWTADNLSTGGGAQLKNTGTFSTNADGTISHDPTLGGTRATFKNDGTFQKTNTTSGGTTEVQATFDNNAAGTVAIDGGTLRLSGGGTSTGSVNVAGGGKLQLKDNNYTFNGGALTGSGTIEINGATTSFSGTTGNASLSVTGGNAKFTGTHTSTGNLSLTSGIVDGTGTATVGALTWNGGDISAATLTTASTSSSIIAGGGVKKITGGAQLNLAGITSWTGDNISTGSGAQLMNTGTFTANADGTIADDQGGTRATFTNNGTFQKTNTASSGTTDLQVSFQNNSAGTVAVDGGTLALSGGGASSGSVTLGAGAKLKISGNDFAFTGGALNGASGTIEIASNTTTFSNATSSTAEVLVNSNTATVRFSGAHAGTGKLNLASGTITGNGTAKFGSLDWTGGSLDAKIESTGNVTISGEGTKSLTGELTLGGNTTWDGSTIAGSSTAKIKNESGKTFSANGTGAITGAATFTNDGTFEKNSGSKGEDTTDIQTRFDNVSTGTISVAGGKLKLTGGGTSTGNVSLTGTLEVSGTDYTFNGGTLNGAGSIDLLSATTTFNAVTSNTTFKVNGGTAKFDGANVGGGKLELTAGTVSGSGTAEFSSLDWSGGSFNAKVKSTGNATLSGGTKNLGGELTLGGNTTWDGGTIAGSGTAKIKNETGKTFSATGDGAITGSFTFTNDGTFQKTSGATGSATDIQTKFDNTGSVSVAAGKLKLTGGGTSTGSVSLTGTLEVSGTDYTFNGGTLNGAGSIDLLSATTTFNAVTSNTTFKVNGGNAKFDGTNVGGGKLDLASGAVTGTGTADFSSLDWSGGSLNAKVKSTGNVTLSGGTKNLGGELTLGGNTTWDGSTIAGSGTAKIKNETGQTFSATSDGAITGSFTFTNDGTFQKTSGATGSATDIQTKFDNTGSVSVAAGKLKLTGGGSSTGSVSLTGTLEVSGTDYTFSGGTLAGAGSIDLLSATTTFNAVTSNTTFKVNGGNAKFDGANFGGGKLELTAGTVSGSGTAEFSSLDWSGGSFNAKVKSTGNVTLSGGTKNLGGELTLGGNTTWDGSTIAGSGTAKIKNETGKTFSATGDGAITGSVTFTNDGTFQKTSGATGSATDIQTKFDNTGSVSVAAGKLKLTGGGTSTGSVSLTGTLEVSGTDYTFNGGTLNGAGSIDLPSATTTFNAVTSNTTFKVNGGNAKFDGTNIGAGKLNLASGAVTGTGTADFSSLDWSGGSLNAKVKSTGNVTLSGGTKNLGGELTLGGNTTWDGSTISGSGTAKIKNETGKTFSATGDGAITGSVTFTNDGTFQKIGGATGSATDIQTKFDNAGSVSVAAGKLKLTGGGTSTGSVSLTGTLEVSGTDYTFSGGTLAGGGSIDLLSATTTFNAVTSNTTFKVNGGNAKFDGANFGGGKLELTAGTVSGSGTADFSSLDWSGGSFNAKVKSTGNTTISGATKNLGGELTLGGNTTWDGSTIAGSGTAKIKNETGKTFSATGDGAITGSVTFTNDGTFQKIGGATGSATDIQTKFDNAGSVSVAAGKLKLTGGGTSTGSVSLTGTLEVSGTDYTFNGGTLNGAGSIDLLSATTTFNAVTSNTTFKVNGGNAKFDGANVGAGKLALASGSVTGTGTADFSSLDWSGGSLNAKVTSKGNTTISTGGTKFLGGELTLDGNTTWTGGSIATGSNAKIKNESGRTFTSSGDSTITNGGAATFTNNGAFTKSSGTTEIQARFDNSGSLQVSGGKLKLTGGGASNGQVTIGGTLEVGGADYTFAAGVFNNSGQVDVQSGNLAVNGGGNSNGGQFSVAPGSRLDFGTNYTLTGGKILGQGRASITGTLFVSGAAPSEVGGVFELKKNSAIGGSGQLAVSGQLEWLGGDMLSSGVTRIVGGGQLLLSGADTKRAFEGSNASGGRTIENSGLVAINDTGSLQLGDGAAINNQAGGNFDVRSDAGIGSTGTGNKGSFANSGTFQKSGGNGVSSIAGVHFTNNSTVWAKAGTLSFDDAVTNNGGTFQSSPGASIQFNGNNARAFGANSRFVGGGAHAITAGANAFSGDFTAQNLTFSGGTLTGPATLHGSLKWTGGDWISGSTFTVATDGVLTIDGSGAKRLYHGSANSGGRVLANEGTIILQGAGHVLLGDGAQLTIAKNATLDIRNDGTVGHARGNQGGVVNNGTIMKSTSNGTATIAQPFTQSSDGKIVVSTGTLAFTSTFSNNNGAINVAQGAAISFGSTFDAGTGALTGTGTIQAANVTAGGLVSPGTSPGTLTLTGNLSLLSTSTLLFELGGSTQGVGYDLLIVGGTASLGGNLSLQFLNGFNTTMAPGSTFTVATSAGITGTFANVANGGKLLTSDGIGFFQVNYGTGSAFVANNIVLSHFVAVPEPSTYVMLGIGAAIIVWQVRRRRR